MPLRPKIELATDLVDTKYIHYADYMLFQRPYAFCNENVSGYLNFLDLKDKSLLTVGSSGDQAISAITRGCKDITVLDICPLAEEVFYLKKAAIETLTPEEFGRLFFYKDYPRTFLYNRKPFEVKKYTKLLNRLKEDNPKVYDFWLELITSRKPEEIRRNLFSQDEEHPPVTKELTDYLKSDKAYYKTRDKIHDIHPEFIISNISHPSRLNRQFDNIVLSNLTTYLSFTENENLFSTLEPFLTDEGKMIFGYLFRTDEYTEYQRDWDVIYDTKRIKSIHPNMQLKTIQGVKGILFESESMKDAVYIYQKKR